MRLHSPCLAHMAHGTSLSSCPYSSCEDFLRRSIVVSKITESVVGVAEYPAAEETMHAMTQANLPARPGCERRTRLAIRGSFDMPIRVLIWVSLTAARNGIFPTNPDFPPNPACPTKDSRLRFWEPKILGVRVFSASSSHSDRAGARVFFNGSCKNFGGVRTAHRAVGRGIWLRRLSAWSARHVILA